MSLEHIQPKYNTYETEGNTIVPFNEAGRTLNFDVKIINTEEKDYIKISNDIFKPKASYKYVLIKFKFKIHELSNGKDDFDMYDFCELKDIKNNTTYIDSRDRLGRLIYTTNKKKDKNLIYMGNFKPGVIKYAYSLFEVPKNCEINNLVLTDTGNEFDVKFKIN